MNSNIWVIKCLVLEVKNDFICLCLYNLPRKNMQDEIRLYWSQEGTFSCILFYFFMVWHKIKTHLLCGLEWVPVHSPGAERNTALGDGSLEQPFVVGGDHLWRNTNIEYTIITCSYVCWPICLASVMEKLWNKYFWFVLDTCDLVQECWKVLSTTSITL